MRLFVKDGESFSEVASRPLRQESELQELLEKHTNLIPLDLDPNRVVVREFPTAAGPIDHLILDARAQLLVIETKLAKNADRRSVIAQAIDYAAQLTKFGPHGLTEALRGRNPEWSLDEWFDASSEKESFFLKLERRLRQGELTLLIVMDEADSRLKDAVRFVNRATHFDCLLAEVRVATVGDREVVFVELYGDETAEDTTGGAAAAVITEEEFVQALSAQGLASEARAFLAARHCATDHGGATDPSQGGFWVYRTPLVGYNYLVWNSTRPTVDIWASADVFDRLTDHLRKAPEPWSSRIGLRGLKEGGRYGKVANVSMKGASEREIRELLRWYLQGPPPEYDDGGDT